ncbi:MAG: aminotransferase class III-fold pyridoxal phosphate-dependent enzyme, partial [Actinobacteria bacterium]|nr:aminotransferase class III-fold pyridoxal phosphate-dependent enzyme [Actinomycetota bacterium]
GNPVSAAVGEAVLLEMEDRGLMAQAKAVGAEALARFEQLAERYDFVRSAKGVGTFLGLDFAVDGEPAPQLAKQVVEAVKARKVLISRIGRHESVLKVRPPLAFGPEELPILLGAIEEALSEV